MDKFIFLIFICFSLLSYSQESSSKNEKKSIEVLGNCNMCKKRIEKAAFSVKGVKYASWDNSSGQLSDLQWIKNTHGYNRKADRR